MSAAVAIVERVAGPSPQAKARMAGLFYLLTIFTGGFSLFASARFIVAGDAAATAANILADQPLFRFGVASDVLSAACYVVVTALFYELFRPVNRSVSLIAALLSVTGCAGGMVSALLHAAPLVLLTGAAPSSALTAEQLQALAYMFLKLNTRAFTLGMVFFGFYCLLIGSLILKSTFLPRALGVLMALAGVGWLVGNLGDLLSPSLGRLLSFYVMIPGGLGEGSLCLWLLVAGVNASRWREQDRRSGAKA